MDQLTRQLVEADFSVECIHGDMTQEDRNKIMQEFRMVLGVLISTDLLSRGIDVQQVSLSSTLICQITLKVITQMGLKELLLTF